MKSRLSGQARKRATIVLGMVIGVLWTLMVLGPGRDAFIPLTVGLTLGEALIGAGFLGGTLLAAMVIRVGLRRFLSRDFMDGEPFPVVHPGAVDVRVLSNTTEQAVLAALIWPAAGLVHGPATVLALACGFAVARLLFWAGYHYWGWLRATAFAMTLYPTVGAGVWAAIGLN